MMRVVAVTDTEGLSGAGIAALRIQRAVAAAGVRASMVVARRQSDAPDVQEIGDAGARRAHAMRRAAMKLAFKAIGARRGEILSGNVFPSGMQRRLREIDADVLHLHWVGLEMLRIEEIARLGKPVVWTMHDEWFALGLEHYAPTAGEPAAVVAGRGALFRSLDDSVRRRKAAAWKSCDPEIVCPSRWLARRIDAAGLVASERIHVISNTVPLDTFQPRDRAAARTRLGLPKDCTVIGMGALNAEDDPRKGFDYLRRALEILSGRANSDSLRVLVFGGRAAGNLSLQARFAGTIRGDADLAAHIAAMDVFVCPSRVENLPNTIAEALACGVPAVAFDVGGIPDLIRHRENGFLARPYDVGELVEGIEFCLAPERRDTLASAARAFAESSLGGASVAGQYISIYRQAFERRRSAS